MGVMIRYILMTSMFIYGGLLLFFGSAFITHAYVSYDFDQFQSDHFSHKYLKVVSHKKRLPPPPPPVLNIPIHFKSPPPSPPRPPPPTPSRLDSLPLPPV
ncbi:hypothetical protein I3842_Q075000 [Carya illinoinensis]|uniref:Uncharacterized protein n=1 Tax=Carya illinoinensis TaxID=32201 RepID=A0A922A4M6_CARIL|nr:hypothetical protein I3842_Q075000 [Carya illinoinensis]